MGLTLKELEAVVAPLSQFNHQELTFRVGDLDLTLRSLLPEEEMDVLRYARACVADGDAVDQATAVEYADRVMTRCLGHSLVVIGSANLREVEALETGEKLPSGLAVRVPKIDAVMGIVGKWIRAMRVSVFRKFHELIDRMEEDVNRLIQFEQKDLDVEIQRLEDKLADLRERKVQAELLRKDPRAAMLNVDSIASPLRQVARETQPEEAVPEEAAPAVAVPTERGPVRAVTVDPDPIPQAPPTRSPLFRETRQPANPVPRVPQESARPIPAPPSTQPIRDSLDDVESSFADPSDSASIDAWNQRLMNERAARMGRVPPHLQAREAARDVAAEETEPAPSRPVREDAENGDPVMRMPPQDLTGREPPVPQQPPRRSTLQSKFRPPTR